MRRVALLLTAALACSSSPKPNTKTFTYQQAINRDVDVLFMVDNSVGMGFIQHQLAASFPAFVETLNGLPGGLPNLHVAFVSSDMGAGIYDVADIPSCRQGGDQGVFQRTPRDPAACATGSLNPGEGFIVAGNVPTAGNHTGGLADVMACLAVLGTNGCNFEHQLASVARALGLDGLPQPAQNARFLRQDAYLQIVLVTDEDDCSAPPFSTIFDPSSKFVSDPLGPLSSFRCNELGHLCGGKKPPRASDGGSVDLSGTCTSTEDDTLLSVREAISMLKSAKTDPAKVLVAAIAGPPAPYVVDFGRASLVGDPAPWPSIRHSCMTNTGSFADPAVRIKQLVDGFGDNGLFQVACASTFQPAMTAIAKQIGKAISEPCLDAGIDETKCTFVDHLYADDGTRTDSPLASCDANGDQAPCWRIATGGQCGTARSVEFKRASAPAGALTTTATCEI